VEIYLASFAGLLSTLLLGVVYLADRYEREPIELIQNFFVSGLVLQLGLVLVVEAAGVSPSWSGPWIVLTAVGAALFLSFQLNRQDEVDEPFDGIVYSVACVGGAMCVIHLYNVPGVIAASPYAGALAPGAEPDLRDLVILATSEGFVSEIGRGAVLIFSAVIFGAILGVLQLRGWAPSRTAAVCALTALATTGLDALAAELWHVRGALALAAVVVAVAVKRRSAFRNRPEPAERDVLVLGLKTVLMVFGAALLATVLITAATERPDTSGLTDLGKNAGEQRVSAAGS